MKGGGWRSTEGADRLRIRDSGRCREWRRYDKGVWE